MLVYSTHDGITQGTLSLLESAAVTEVFSINAIRTNSGIRIFDLYVPAGFDPTQPQRIIVNIPGLKGDARNEVEDSISLIETHLLSNVIIIGIYGKPDINYRSLDEIEGNMVIIPNGKEINTTFSGYSVGDVGDGAFYKRDDDFTRSVISYVSRFVPVVEVIFICNSNGGVLSMMMNSTRKDRKTTKIITNSSNVTTSRAFGHSFPINVLTLHGGADKNVPYVGGAGTGGAAGYTFPSGTTNFEDWVTNNGNAAVVAMGTTFENVDDCPIGSEFFDYIKDNGSVRNQMLYVSTNTSDAPCGVGGVVYPLDMGDGTVASHGLGDIDDIDDLQVGNTRVRLNAYFFDFIQRYIPTKW